MNAQEERPSLGWRARAHEIIFEADTPAGRAFDIALMVCIIVSVAAVVLDSVTELHTRYGVLFDMLEWSFTILFTLEYVARVITVHRPLAYVFSFFGLVDLLSILPSYASVFISGTQSLLVIRALRLLRVFRLFKLGHMLGEAHVLLGALRASRAKITVFVGSVLIITVIVGSFMYVIEGPVHGYTSIPRGVYWAIVTLTTVGYGDIYPRTDMGQLLASAVMIMGYGILAVPTGIVTVELAHATRKQISNQACPFCSNQGHDTDATYCKFCGGKL